MGCDRKLAARLLRRSDILIDRGRFDAALETCRQALEADPANAEIYRRIGGLAVMLKQPRAAVEALEIALQLDASDAAALCNMGAALRELGRADEARKCLQTSTRANPGHPSGWFNLGVVYADLARWSDAAACYKRALQGEPRHAKAASGWSTALRALGRFGEAINVARQALLWAPDVPELHISLSEALLANGELEAGFAENEWRWRVPAWANARRHTQVPPWRGEALQGRRLLVHAEQGFGDQLQMCRFVSHIPDASEIILEVPAPLTRLLSSLATPSGTSLQVVLQGGDLPDHDLQCPIMSLPMACGIAKPRDVPSQAPYLHATPSDVAVWQARVRDVPGVRVGLCWSSGVRPDLASRIVQARKSVPFSMLAPLSSIENCSFVSLQAGHPAAELQSPSTRPKVLDFAAHLQDFADTAALVECLDLVITVDTAVAHLAGALGRPVWLLNRCDADWRWSVFQDCSPWYPTLRQFRQPEPGAWAEVINEVHGNLAELARFKNDNVTKRGFSTARPLL
jgi:Flp pilus assembly protein TadD